MLSQIRHWLGKERTYVLVGSLMVTGLLSLVLNITASDEEWSLTAQTLLVIAFLGIGTWIIAGRLSAETRLRFLFTIIPALGLGLLSIIVPGEFFALIIGLAFGWLLAAQFLMRNRIPREYKDAIKALRRADYTEAARHVTQLIKQEPENLNHYQFRAEMYRLDGKMSKAIKDYEKINSIRPDSPVGYNGLSEVYLQQSQYDLALKNAREALKREPDLWVAPYNLGMIEDRLQDSQNVIEHLSMALKSGLPDSRHRLLTYLWLARAHYRLGDETTADEVLIKLRQERKGLGEWSIIMDEDAASTLRAVLEDDIKLARRAIEDKKDADALFNGDAV
ncbi:MAG: tetratricopeptide repeat protein [Chloroflexi bacterium]|nr:tetratricopeptide repeat protein [Chloroflexota bacterium]